MGIDEITWREKVESDLRSWENITSLGATKMHPNIY